MVNNIEGVKKIIHDAMSYTCSVPECPESMSCEECAVHRVCQLFLQPLDDKELREALKRILLSEGHKIGWACKVYNPPKGMGFPNPRPDAETTILQVVNQILALLQPKIEEARRQERERMIEIVVKELEHRKLIEHTHPLYGGNYCQMCLFVETIRQALKGGE